MKVKEQLLALIVGLLNTLIVGLGGYIYLSDKASASNLLVTETLERKESDSRLMLELEKKVSKDAFNEFKVGQQTIIDYINESNKRDKIYQDIIKDLTFIDLDTINVDYPRINFAYDGNIQ